VTVDPPQPVEVRFARADGTGTERIHASAAGAGEHTVPLYLMEPDADYEVTASATAFPDDPAPAVVVHTGVVPELVRSALDVTGVSSVPMIGTHLPCSNDAIAVIYATTTGRLLWYQELDPEGMFDGMHMVQFTEDHTVLGETSHAVVERDLTGAVLLQRERGVDYDRELHHDLFKHAGDYYLLYQEDLGGGLTSDGFVVWDATGAEIADWRAADRFTIPADAGGDWLHTNAIFVDPTGDVLLSFYARQTLAKVEGDLASPSFGTTLWTLPGLPSEPFAEEQFQFDVDWSQVVGGDGFSFQHSATVRNDGRVMVLDNFSGRALVFATDEVAHIAVAEEAWDAFEDTCGTQGTARDSTSGHTFVGCDGPHMREYDPAAGLVWSADVTGCGAGGVESVARFYPLEGW
jgi:hypothetical protein